jgi:hypothetical protein
MESRRALIEAVAPLASAACAKISGSADALALAYQPGCEGSLAESLAASRGEEERLRQTVRGPHRDDLEISLNGLKASAFASEGQQRGIALALKIAQARHLESLHSQPPVLLLDDIFGELDTSRRNRLLETLPAASQTLITTTFLDWAVAPRPAGYEGQSLAPLVNGTASGPWRSYFFCEHVDLQPTLTWEGVRTNSEMYARYFDQQPVSEFLHDLKADPDELKNLASDAAAATTLTKLRALCDQEMNARGGPLLPMNQRVTKPAGKKKKKA